MSKSLDRLTLLETFVRIADAGSISAAARDLGLSQPSVSRQLAELESRFKAQLMHRTTHSLSLTAAGAELLADARQLLDEWEALEEKHLDAETIMRGRLSVVAPIALGQLHLFDIVLKFQQQYPHITLSWQLQDDTIRFAEVGCDCWIKIGPVPDDSLIVEPLGQVERMVVSSPQLLQTHSQPKTPKAMERLPFVSLAPFEGDRIPLVNSQGKQVVVSPATRMTTNSIMALRKATLAGLGASVLPRWFIEEDLAQQKLVDLLPKWRAPRLTIHIATLPGRYRPRRLKSWLEFLRAEIPNIPGIE
ncbi:MAG: LysR family transcriptional regulator [Leptolyngbya sp. SIO1D8]|nr:LysR family transcriptional regulator [Leptolyngbya sp. SIO1D8]